MNSAIQLSLSADRDTRLTQIRQLFPSATGLALDAEWPGGLRAAKHRLAHVDAQAYARSRNHLHGEVTGLSPYLRHGCLELSATMADIGQRFGEQAEKLISELAYRDYFRQVWYRFGSSILHNMEPPKVLLGQQPLPRFITQGLTGLVCMDEIVRQLQLHGYVHNHARLWLAAYLLHWLKVDWKQAADWFESQLLDGDIASNHLSWQWVASSFSHKPYIFNQQNLQQFGGQDWCEACKIRCPFAADYETLQAQWLQAVPVSESVSLPAVLEPAHSDHVVAPENLATVVWVHDEMLSPTHPLLASGLPAVFVFDPELYCHWPLKRLQFMADCLAEMPSVQVWQGNTSAVLRQMGGGTLLSQKTPQTRLRQAVSSLQVVWQAEPTLHAVSLTDYDLMRFTRYWKKVGPALKAAFYPA